MKFDNGSAFNLSAEFLRIHSPAADSKVRSIGGEKVIGKKFHLYCSSSSSSSSSSCCCCCYCWFIYIYILCCQEKYLLNHELFSFFL